MRFSFVSRRLSLAGFLAAALSGPNFVASAQAQGDAAAGYPKQPIRMLIGFAPGGGNDLIGRVIAQKLSERLGQPVVVENRVGAGGIVAAEATARATPDGYTLLVAPIGTTVFNPVLFKKLPYDMETSFAWITMIADYPLYLTVNSKLPVNSVNELVAYAKAHPNEANYASTSGVFQLTNELFKIKTGTAFEMIPFKSSNEMTQAVITGQAMIGFIDPSSLMAHVKAGAVKLLAMTGPKRVPDLPNIPTMAEAGAEGVVVNGDSALVAPAATPPAIIKKLEGEVNAIIKLPDVVERFKSFYVYPAGGPGEQYAKAAAEARAKWREVVQQAKIPLQ